MWYLFEEMFEVNGRILLNASHHRQVIFKKKKEKRSDSHRLDKHNIYDLPFTYFWWNQKRELSGMILKAAMDMLCTYYWKKKTTKLIEINNLKLRNGKIHVQIQVYQATKPSASPAPGFVPKPAHH